MHVLLLNDMRSSKIEILQPIARGTLSSLWEFLKTEHVERYKDGNEHQQPTTPGNCHYSNINWSKSFRKDGPLEWFNEPFLPFDGPLPPLEAWGDHIVCVMSREEMIGDAARRWDEQLGVLPEKS